MWLIVDYSCQVRQFIGDPMKSRLCFYISSAVLIVSLLTFVSCQKDSSTEPAKDTEKPTVAILYPPANSELKPDTIYTIIADAADNTKVASVEFLIDGKSVGTDNAQPYEYRWNTQGQAGDHTIMAKASDDAGNIGQSQVVTVRVKINNPPALPTNPSPANNAPGVTTYPILSWTCSDPEADAITYDVYFGPSDPPTTQVATGQSVATLSRTGLAGNTKYYWRVNAKDSKGATTIGTVWSFTTGAPVIAPSMVAVGAGTFTAAYQGQHTLVSISSFNMDKYEVTYELWSDIRNWGLVHGYTDLALGRNGYNPVETNNPVTEVTWFDAVKWCNARSEKENLTPVYCTDSTQSTVFRTGQTIINNDAVKWIANGYRLPTDAEWEFAARGGTQNHNYRYSGSDSINDVGWFEWNSGLYTHSVATKGANELGIYDMSGNVGEMCWDWSGFMFPIGGTIDPRGPATTQVQRMSRNGSFHETVGTCEVRRRISIDPYVGDFTEGFRCVRY